VLVADDHALVRAGLRELLDDEPDMRVVGEARDGGEAVALALRERPDVVLMDVSMPVLCGVEATRQIRAAAPEVRVLALTAQADGPAIDALLGAGVSGCLLKTAAELDLRRAVRATAAGQSVLDPLVAQYLSHAWPGQRRSPTRSASWRCCGWPPAGRPTSRSARASTSAPAPCRTTWRTSTPSSTWPRAPRRSRSGCSAA
jgi:DNA-binding NarL/FixJ family response regulator